MADNSTLAVAIALMKKIEGQLANDYNALKNKPKINGKELDSSTTLDEIGVPDDISDAPTEPLNQDDLDWIMSGDDGDNGEEGETDGE